jgi:hypothetical protein
VAIRFGLETEHSADALLFSRVILVLQNGRKASPKAVLAALWDSV